MFVSQKQLQMCAARDLCIMSYNIKVLIKREGTLKRFNKTSLQIFLFLFIILAVEDVSGQWLEVDYRSNKNKNAF